MAAYRTREQYDDDFGPSDIVPIDAALAAGIEQFDAFVERLRQELLASLAVPVHLMTPGSLVLETPS